MRKIVTSLAALSIGTSFGAVLEDFNGVGYDPTDQPNLSSVNSGSWSYSGPDGFAVLDSAGGTNYGNIGGYYTDYSSGTPGASASFAVPAATLVGGPGTPYPTLSTSFALYDVSGVDPDGAGPLLPDSTRNTFGISFQDFITVGFTPAAAGAWNISYTINGVTTPTSLTLGAESLTTLTFIFENDHINALFNNGGALLDLGITAVDADYLLYNIANGGALSYSVASGADLGDNFLYVQNIVASSTVPEPSAALLGAIGALGLLRRRRNH